MSTILNKLDLPKVAPPNLPLIETFHGPQEGPEPLSVCMIVKDEEDYLEGCLESIAGFAREIVIVDTGSTDKTLEIAKRYTSNIHHFDWCDDFAAARNEGIKYADMEWLLFLDADERLDPASKPILHEIFKSSKLACELTIRNHFSDGSTVYVGQQPKMVNGEYIFDTPLLRLCRNVRGVHFEGRVHELLNHFFEGKPITQEPGVVIHHYGKLSPGREDAKKEKYFNLALKEASLRNDPQSWFSAIQEGLRSSHWEAVLKSCQEYRKTGGKNTRFIAFAYGSALLGLGKLPEAENILDNLIIEDRNDVVCLITMGQIKAKMDKVEESEAYFRCAIARGSSLAALNLSELYIQRGEPRKAVAALKDGLVYNPEDKMLLNPLGGMA